MIPDVSIILPCRNEAAFIDACLASVLAQEIHGLTFELIVVDGMSEDGTRQKIEAWRERDARVRLVENPGRIVPTGLNVALAIARAPIVVRMDAHCTYPPDYVQSCVEALNRSGADNVGGVVITLPRGRSEGAILVQAVSTHRFGMGGAKFRSGAPEGPADTVPYGCFQRQLFEQIGFFDERLERHQDYEFNARIRASGRQVWLDPQIQINYYNQGTVGGLLKQAYGNGRWNTFAWNVAPYEIGRAHV